MYVSLFWTEIVASVVYLHLAQGRGGVVFGAHLGPEKWNECTELLCVAVVTRIAVASTSFL